MCEKCNYEDYIDKCNLIIDDLDNEWAHEVTEGICDWVLKNQHITEKQKNAIDHIELRISEKIEEDY